ncbi:homocitrate synthase [Trichoderma compactum]
MPQATATATTWPYQHIADFISNVGKFKIIESTLREGEQFANAFFDTAIHSATAPSEFGVDYIELTSPCASPASRADCEAICKLGLKVHTRCTLEDAKIAFDCVVDGVDVFIGTSSFLQKHSHGKDMAAITKQALEVVNYIKSRGVKVRFSSEDSFRCVLLHRDLVDLLSLYRAVDNAGVHRVGIADTVGCASPRQVYDLVRTLRGVVKCDIECHFHDDTSCAVANACSALEAGATHIDTSVLGIGERNGIAPLGAFLARMIVAAPEYVKRKYDLHRLKDTENIVVEAVHINVPFNDPVTGFCAFTHKAGIHSKAIMINPEDFGMSRCACPLADRLTGWNSIKSRVEQLGLDMTDAQVELLTTKIKAMADVPPLAIDDADSIIRAFHLDLQERDTTEAWKN